LALKEPGPIGLGSSVGRPPEASIKEDKLSKFKFRHARLFTAIVALVAIVVDSGAAHKF
jgi:hypothetical protein